MAEARRILDDLFEAFSIMAGGNYVSMYDIKERVTRYSPAAVELFGLPGEYIPDGLSQWTEYVHPEDRSRYETIMGELLLGEKRAYNLACRVRLQTGDYGLFRLIGAMIREDDGRPGLIGGSIVNEGLLEHTDPVTVLRNQYGFFTDMAAVLCRKHRLTALLIGISRMSEINGKHGYGYGNHVLQQLGWVIQEQVGQDGIVYRMDGSKFVVLSEQLSARQMETVYEKIRRQLLGGIMVGDVRQTLIANGGMIVTEDIKMNEHTIYTCLKYAYKESKQRRHGELVSFNGGGTDEQMHSLEMIDEIRRCIIRDCEGFSLFYQPVYDLEAGKLLGVEALLRWHSEKYGDVDPMEYVPILERDFVFEELGYWILWQAMTDGARFMEKLPDFTLGVNVASVQIENEFFRKEILEIAEDTGFPLENLCLELTKDCRQVKERLLKDTVSSLREDGIRFVLDDFGSGVGSIDFLRELSPDYIKFDMKYIRDIDKNQEDQQIVSHMSGLAQACGAQVCIKGVETEEIERIVRGYEVNFVQGFYYSEPSEAEEIMALKNV